MSIAQSRQPRTWWCKAPSIVSCLSDMGRAAVWAGWAACRDQSCPHAHHRGSSPIRAVSGVSIQKLRDGLGQRQHLTAISGPIGL